MIATSTSLNYVLFALRRKLVFGGSTTSYSTGTYYCTFSTGYYSYSLNYALLALASLAIRLLLCETGATDLVLYLLLAR